MLLYTRYMLEYKSICEYLPGLRWYISVYADIYWWQVRNLWLQAKLRRPVNSQHIPWTHLIIPRNSHHILYQPCIYQVWILLYLVYIGVYRHMTVYESIYRHMTVYASICAYKTFWQNVDKSWIRTLNLMHTARLSRPLDHECWCSACVCIV
jgi:hypothetical protein